MVAEDGRDRDRTSGEEEVRSDFGGEEPVAPTPIVGGEATEPAGAGSEAASKAAEEEAARKAAEEEAAKKAAEEAASEAAEEEAAKAAESAGTAEAVREELRIEPRGPPYPKATDSSGREYTYQVIVTRRVTGKQRPEKPSEPKEPPKPKEKEEKEVKEKEEKEERSEETAKGKGKKGKAKNPNWRPRSEEGERYRRVKGLLRLLDKRGGRVEDLPEHLQELIHSFGPGGPSSGSGVARPAAKPRPSAPVPEPEEEPYWKTLSDVPEPDPAVVDQRKVTSGRLQEPEREERKEEESEPAGEPIRLRSRSRARGQREITVHPRVTDLARSRAKRLGGDPEGILGSNYRRRRAAAAEAAGQSRARGTVRESIIQGVYGLDDQTQACSSCDERQDKAREAVRAYASRVVERSRTKPKDKKPVFVTETAPNLTRPKKRPAAAQPESAEKKRREKEPKEAADKPKEGKKEEKKKEKEAEAVSAAAVAAEESEYSEYSYTYATLTPTSEEEEEREVPKRD